MFVQTDHRNWWPFIKNGIARRYCWLSERRTPFRKNPLKEVDLNSHFDIAQQDPEDFTKVNKLLSHRYKPTPYKGDAVLFQSERPYSDKIVMRKYWQHMIRGNLEFRNVLGTHVSMLHMPFVTTLARKLEDVLKERQAKNP
jgi:thioesterase domain-containing protein